MLSKQDSTSLLAVIKEMNASGMFPQNNVSSAFKALWDKYPTEEQRGDASAIIYPFVTQLLAWTSLDDFRFDAQLLKILTTIIHEAVHYLILYQDPKLHAVQRVKNFIITIGSFLNAHSRPDDRLFISLFLNEPEHLWHPKADASLLTKLAEGNGLLRFEEDSPRNPYSEEVYFIRSKECLGYARVGYYSDQGHYVESDIPAGSLLREISKEQIVSFDQKDIQNAVANYLNSRRAKYRTSHLSLINRLNEFILQIQKVGCGIDIDNLMFILKNLTVKNPHIRSKFYRSLLQTVFNNMLTNQLKGDNTPILFAKLSKFTQEMLIESGFKEQELNPLLLTIAQLMSKNNKNSSNILSWQLSEDEKKEFYLKAFSFIFQHNTMLSIGAMYCAITNNNNQLFDYFWEHATNHDVFDERNNSKACLSLDTVEGCLDKALESENDHALPIILDKIKELDPRPTVKFITNATLLPDVLSTMVKDYCVMPSFDDYINRSILKLVPQFNDQFNNKVPTDKLIACMRMLLLRLSKEGHLTLCAELISTHAGLSPNRLYQICIQATSDENLKSELKLAQLTHNFALDWDQKITFRTLYGVRKTQSLRDYVKAMKGQNETKFNAICNSYTRANLRANLGLHQQCISSFFGKTSGAKLYDKLVKEHTEPRP